MTTVVKNRIILGINLLFSSGFKINKKSVS